MYYVYYVIDKDSIKSAALDFRVRAIVLYIRCIINNINNLVFMLRYIINYVYSI
jgi:hypothetical protein